MPKTKLAKPSKYEPLYKLICGELDAAHKGRNDLARACGVSESTMIRRLNSYHKDNLGDLTLSEISAIGKSLGIPVDEIRAKAIQY